MGETITKFSANLGFLWTELTLPDAIRAAARAGFDAVECHWPFDTKTADVNATLKETGLQMLSLNTASGGQGEFGLCALTDRTPEARNAIDQAIDYAVQTNTAAVHAMAGVTSGYAANAVFLDNLQYACDRARIHGITILIEPMNNKDMPGYFLRNSTQALDILRNAARGNLKLLFDCYHVQITEGDLLQRLEICMPHIGHIQFSSVPDRGVPTKGVINYPQVFSHIRNLGYTAPLGAEYRPNGTTGESLDWMNEMRGAGES